MIQQFINEQQSFLTISGFVAKYFEPILAQVNPSSLQNHDLFELIRAEQSIIGSLASQ